MSNLSVAKFISDNFMTLIFTNSPTLNKKNTLPSLPRQSEFYNMETLKQKFQKILMLVLIKSIKA